MDRLFLTSRRHWWERVNNTVKEFHPSNTSGSSRARTRTTRWVDRDANDCAISQPVCCWCMWEYNVDGMVFELEVQELGCCLRRATLYQKTKSAIL